MVVLHKNQQLWLNNSRGMALSQPRDPQIPVPINRALARPTLLC